VPLSRSTVDRLLGPSGSRAVDLRNAALLAVAYDTLARRSELVALDLADLEPNEDGSATVLIRMEPQASATELSFSVCIGAAALACGSKRAFHTRRSRSGRGCAGLELAEVMQMGGWKTPAMVARYSERLLANNRGGGAKLAAKQGRVNAAAREP
jgi:hypothetical protein